MSARKPRRSLTKPNEDKNQTKIGNFFHKSPKVSKNDKQEKFKAKLFNESGSDLKEDLEENEKENGGDTKDDGYVKIFRVIQYII